MFFIRTILIVVVFLLGPFSALVQAQDNSKDAPKKPPIVPAEKLAEGWEQIDDRLIFLMVRLASTEASLEATENAFATSSQNQNRKTRQAKQADKKNEDMDRQGGGPLKWSLFYGRTAESFFYHPTDRNTTYHTTTILSQQAPANDNRAAAGVPSRQGLPVHQRPPQFDYIYRANESAKARAEKEVSELGGKTAELTERRQRLEAEQAGLWCEIAFRSVSHYDLDKKPLYRFEPLLSANSGGDSRVQFETIRGAASFMALALSIVDAAQKDQLTTFSKMKPAVAKARQDLNDGWLRNGVDVTERKSLEGKFHALAKRLEESASNLSDSYVVALEGDLAKDQQRKDTFRGLLQESLIRYAEIILALDEMATLMKDDWKIKPDIDKPIQFVGLAKTEASWSLISPRPQSNEPLVEQKSKLKTKKSDPQRQLFFRSESEIKKDWEFRVDDRFWSMEKNSLKLKAPTDLPPSSHIELKQKLDGDFAIAIKGHRQGSFIFFKVFGETFELGNTPEIRNGGFVPFQVVVARKGATVHCSLNGEMKSFNLKEAVKDSPTSFSIGWETPAQSGGAVWITSVVIDDPQ